jgi:hypothetical protein
VKQGPGAAWSRSKPTLAAVNNPRMTLILRPMNKRARLMGWGDHWGRDDYVILDRDGRSVGRIYKDYVQGWRSAGQRISWPG